jgi:hypothetical protein
MLVGTMESYTSEIKLIDFLLHLSMTKTNIEEKKGKRKRRSIEEITLSTSFLVLKKRAQELMAWC